MPDPLTPDVAPPKRRWRCPDCGLPNEWDRIECMRCHLISPPDKERWEVKVFARSPIERLQPLTPDVEREQSYVPMPRHVLGALAQDDPEKQEMLRAWDHENELRRNAEESLDTERSTRRAVEQERDESDWRWDAALAEITVRNDAAEQAKAELHMKHVDLSVRLEAAEQERDAALERVKAVEWDRQMSDALSVRDSKRAEAAEEQREAAANEVLLLSERALNAEQALSHMEHENVMLHNTCGKYEEDLMRAQQAISRLRAQIQQLIDEWRHVAAQESATHAYSQAHTACASDLQFVLADAEPPKESYCG